MHLRPRRLLPLAAAAAAAAVVLAGCAGAPGDDDPVEIRFTWWGGDARAATTQQVIDDFSALHPEIRVQAEPSDFESYWDRLATDAAAGNAPDVITLASPYTIEYATAGALLPLSHVDDALDRTPFADSTLAGATVDGELYGLPTGGNAIGVVLNPRIFEEAGVELPDAATWTWDDFVEIASAISANTPDGVYGAEHRVNDTLGVAVSQHGTHIYDDEGGLAVEADALEAYWTTVLELLDSGGMPAADLTQELYTLGPEQTLMGQGRAAMTFAFSNLLGTYAAASGDELRLVLPPGETEGVRPGASVQASQYYGISAQSEHPREAAMLIDYLVNAPEAGRLILADRGLPFNGDVLDEIIADLDPSAQLAAEYVRIVTEEGAPPAPPTPPGAAVQKELTERLDSEVLFGRLTPAEAAEQFVTELSAALGG